MTLPNNPAMIANNPQRFARVFLRILDKNKKLQPLMWNRAQAHFHQHRTGRDLILKARQLGFSTYMQGEMFRRLVTSTRTTMTMAHDDETTQKLRRMADRFWENCRFGGIQPARKYANGTLATYPEYDSESIIATAGSKEAGRGGTYTDFHGSEVAFWKNAEAIIAGAMQGGNPDVVLESTPNGAGGWFYERCMEAHDDDGVWKLHFYPWWWDDGYKIATAHDEVIEYTDEEKNLVVKHNLTPEQIKWRREKKKELKRLFVQEYPEDPLSCFLTSGNSYFGDMSEVFTAPLTTEYKEGHEYAAGLDFGQENDYLSMTVIDKTVKEQVDLLHINKLSWGEMRRRVKAKYDYWHLMAVEAETNSMGETNIEALEGLGMTITRFDTSNQTKNDLMAAYYDALHEQGLRLQDVEPQKHEHQVFVSERLPSGAWRLAAEGTNHDDTVISGALAWRAVEGAGWAEWARKKLKELQQQQEQINA